MIRTPIVIILFLLLVSCSGAKNVHNVVIIGGGLMGSSAGWELSKSGAEVLLLEQQDENYTFGSSLGEARISRSLGEQGDIFSYLQQQSVAQTAELIDYLNETENAQNHSMDDIYTTSPVTYIRHKSQQDDVDRLLFQQSDPYEFAPDSKTAKALFGMQIPESLMIIREYKKYTGTLNPNLLISKLHKAMNYAGNDVLYNEKVISLKRKNALYQIQIKNTRTGQVKTILSKKVVVAAGPYNGQVIQDIAPYFKELITPKRLFLSFLKINPAVYNRFSSDEQQRLQESYPAAEFSSEIFYSMIENYDTNGHPVLKVGGHFLRTKIDDLDSVWAKALTQGEIDWSKTNTLRYLNMLDLPIEIEDLEFVQGYSCVYSLTDSEVPYVTHIVDENNEIDKNIVLVGGMSGVGAKGSLAYGLIASNLLLNKDDPSIMYQKTKAALGVERLEEDIDALNN